MDLNPHQIDAALFAFGSPLSKGALLADEVGLGKTIEAGLVIAQRWAENRRRILIITPSNLRKQWHQELSEKFFLPCQILQARSFNAAIKSGDPRPFEPEAAVVICSYQFTRNKADEVHRTLWDLVVIDEAHRLRNVYKPSNIVANALKDALASRTKLLLTATPLQNSLLELYGLMSFIDEHAFGDLKSFREQFAGSAGERALPALRERLRPFCHRTLRRQVTAYVPYTRRFAMVEEFTPAASEDRLYALVSDYLRRETLQALPAGQRALTTLVLRKLLASSTFAITGALEAMARRLRASLAANEADADGLADDYEALDVTAEEWGDDADETLSPADRATIAQEAEELESYASLAASIEQNAKGEALLKALAIAFDKAEELGAERKAIIFTESRRTQAYLLRRLAESPYAEGVVLFNVTETVIGEIAKKVGQLYEKVHPGEGLDKIAFPLDPNKRASLELAASFEGVDRPPQAYFSQSHLDTLGLCVFLALAIREHPNATILVLGSVDEPHVDRVIEMIYDLTETFQHAIVTTHYRPWREKYRWGLLKPDKPCHFVELIEWGLSEGIRLTNCVPEIERLSALLAATALDIQAVTSKAGVVLEQALDHLTQKYECSLPRHGRGYTLGELLDAVSGKLRAAMKVEHRSGDLLVSTVELGPMLDKLKAIAGARNVLGAHFNTLAHQLTGSEGIAFARQVHALADALVCPEHGWPMNDKSGSYWRNSGDTRRLHPLRKPN